MEGSCWQLKQGTWQNARKLSEMEPLVVLHWVLECDSDHKNEIAVSKMIITSEVNAAHFEE